MDNNKEKIIIALIGKTGSGKDVFGNYLQKKFKSVVSFRFSQPLTEALGIFFEKIKKQDQQWLVNNLRDRFGEDILSRAIIKKIDETKEKIIVLNGVRVRQEFDLIKKLNGKFIYIDCSPEKRWERIQERNEKEDDKISFEKFQEIEKNRSEKQIEELGEKADFFINNNGIIDDLEKEADKIINIIINA